MQAMKVLRDARAWGVGALAVVTALGVLASMVYISPPGDKIVAFYTDDASSIRPGITVRIAGMVVGKIKDLTMEPDRVRVRATVEGNAFVGDQSSIQVRMLTVAGGYYVNIDSLGEESLDQQPIPQERVTLPYSLVRVLADTTDTLERVQTAPINQTLNQIQEGLTGSNLDTISAIVDAGTMLTESLQRQRGQLTSILNLSDDYIAQLAGYRDQLKELIEKVAILEETLVIYGKGFAGTLLGLGNVTQGLKPVADFYAKHRDDIMGKILYWQQAVRAWADRTGVIVRVLRRVRDRMMTTLEAQNAAPELLATDLCIPVAGSPC
jgi:phospholipid/cholesterol/gamma-HCH transport system substrate-binding protein